MDQGVHRKQHLWRLDGSEMGKIFQGTSLLTDTDAETTPSANSPRCLEGKFPEVRMQDAA